MPSHFKKRQRLQQRHKASVIAEKNGAPKRSNIYLMYLLLKLLGEHRGTITCDQ